VDGQNLFHSAREAFGYTYPNYDIGKPAKAVCASQGLVAESDTLAVSREVETPIALAFQTEEAAAMPTRP
jgi:hypothetical protein